MHPQHSQPLNHLNHLNHLNILSTLNILNPPTMGVKLRTQHLWISGDIVAETFGAETAQVYTVYYPQMRALLLAPMDDELFPTIHKGGLQMLKTRNMQGDKTISLQEIIIDNDIDDTDRDLVFMHQSGMRMLHVTL